MSIQKLYTNVYNSIIYNSLKVKITQMSINWWVNKQNVAYLYNGILFSNKKEWGIDTCYNMDELWKYNAMRKASHKKPHIICSIFMKCPE